MMEKASEDRVFIPKTVILPNMTKVMTNDKGNVNDSQKKKGSVCLEELSSVVGSKQAVVTAFQETLINAAESGGDVEVSARNEDDNLIIEIAENGRGMSNEERDKSQLPFFKVLGAKGSDRPGFGAYIAHESAKYCGGDIHIESIEGAGTTASISFKVSDQVS